MDGPRDGKMKVIQYVNFISMKIKILLLSHFQFYVKTSNFNPRILELLLEMLPLWNVGRQKVSQIPV
jgi:hypothetical protein